MSGLTLEQESFFVQFFHPEKGVSIFLSVE